MKASIVHCYSDENRGDAGIILSIISLLKTNGISTIDLHSTFGSIDKRFPHVHSIVEHETGEKVFPAIFPEPIAVFGSKSSVGKKLLKVPLFFFYFLRALVLLISPRHFKNILFKDERGALEALEKADIIVSKGGSFLYSNNGISGSLFFLRMFYIFLLGFRLKKRIIIFSQSIGPLDTWISKTLFEKYADRFFLIGLREEKCLGAVKAFERNIGKSVFVIPDAAFGLNHSALEKHFTKDKGELLIGFTIRPHVSRNSQNDKVFEESFYSAIANCFKALDAEYPIRFIFIPQVIGPSKNEDDREAYSRFYDFIAKLEMKNVVTIDDNLTPKELISIYGELDLLIGMRLHSAIFALVAGTPVVPLSYHGTKAHGVMHMIDSSVEVIDVEDLCFDSLYKNVIAKLQINKLEQKAIDDRVALAKEQLDQFVLKIIESQ